MKFETTKRAIIRTKTLKGNKAKTYVWLTTNNAILIKSVILIGWRELEVNEFAIKDFTFSCIVHFLANCPDATQLRYREEGR